MIDAHIHLDMYTDCERSELLGNLSGVEALISVSFDLASCKSNKSLAEHYHCVKPAYGFHPEQKLPSENELAHLLLWMEREKDSMVAIGEVGLPYYRRLDGLVSEVEYGRYTELLEVFVKKASEWKLPIALHAVYDDAPVVCDLLEKHSVAKAHFHWFKGDDATLARMSANGYAVSVTPDIVYEEEIQMMAREYPLSQIMVETDGPWKFEGAFKGSMTHPFMMKESLKELSRLKELPLDEVRLRILQNTKNFYRI